MNKEVIEKAREYLKQREKQDAEETKEDLRTLYKILKDEHREGTLTIEKGLKYISKLELEVASYKMIHEHDLAMIEEAKGNAVKWSKERDNFKSILDKVTDFVTKISAENAEKYNSIKQKEVDFSEWNLADGILNIIEREKNKLNSIKQY